MKLAKRNNQSAEYKSLRNKSVFSIEGNPEDAERIKAIDEAIGNEIKCYDGANNALTWYHECSDWCADYEEGYGCCWIMDHDDVDEFKALWKKYKNIA